MTISAKITEMLTLVASEFTAMVVRAKNHTKNAVNRLEIARNFLEGMPLVSQITLAIILPRSPLCFGVLAG
jgi:hypothetical protein